MTNLAGTELLRTRWRRALERHALDTVDRDDFAVGGSRDATSGTFGAAHNPPS